MTIFKRLMSFALAMVLLIGMVPTVAFGAGIEEEPSATEVTDYAETETAETTVPDAEPEETLPAPAETEALEEILEDLSQEAANSDSGTCGENLTWEVDDEGVLTISGTGPMWYINQNAAPWQEEKPAILSVVIGEGVTRVSDYAFYDCTSLTDVTISDTVTYLGSLAFGNCTSLTELYIPESVVTITTPEYNESLIFGCAYDLVIYCGAPSEPEGWEFGWNIYDSSRGKANTVFGVVPGERSYWESLDISGGTVAIREGITSIPSGVFTNNTDLTEVTIPSSVTKIADSAFAGCGNLVYAHLPDHLVWIGNSAFEGCRSLISAMMPDTVTYLGRYAFADCTGLTGIRLSSGLTDIGERAFYYCTGPSNLTIPDSVTTIGMEAFSGCTGLNTVVFSDKLTSIGEFAFSGCSGLKTVELPDTLTVLGNGAFNYCSALTEAVLPSGLRSIGARAFDSCSSLRTVNLNLPALTEIGDQAFYRCTSLESVHLPGSLATIGDDVFVGCKSLKTATLDQGITTLGYRMFWQCSALESISLPDAITVIPVNAFANCTSLTHVDLPSNLTEIGQGAFSSCGNLTAVTLPKTLKTLGANVFWGTAITSIHLPASLDMVWGNPFAHCSSLKTITVASGNGVFEVEDGVLFTAGGKMLITYPLGQEGTSFSIPRDVETIGEFAFAGATNLQKVTFPESVTSIGAFAFSGAGIVEAELPEGLTFLGNSAFSDSMLEKVMIPSTLEEIGASVFQQARLQSVVIQEGVQIIGKDAFGGNYSLKTLVIPESVTDIEDRAFSGCMYLETLVLPETLTYIGTNAFSGCNSLKTVHYTGNEEQWGEIYIRNGNSALENAEIFFDSGGVIPQSGTYEDIKWSLDSRGTLVIEAVGESAQIPVFLLPSQTPWYSFRQDVRKLIINRGITEIGSNAFNGFSNLLRLHLPEGLWVIGAFAFADCDALSTVVFGGTQDQWDRVRIWPPNGALTGAKVLIGKVVDYVNNYQITLNGPGSAFAYYQWMSNSTVHYQANGNAGTAQTNHEGMFCVPLGTFEECGFYEGNVYITQLGEEVLEEPLVMEVAIWVKYPSYSQSWQLSLDTAIASKLKLGVDLSDIKAEATLGSFGLKNGVGATVSITREYEDGVENLELIGERDYTRAAEIKLGPTFQAGSFEFTDWELGGSVEGAFTEQYGITFEDYDISQYYPSRAAATFLLGEALTSLPHSVMFHDLYHFLLKSVYEDAGAQIVTGGGFGLMADAGLDVNSLAVATINDKELFKLTGLSVGGEISVSSGVEKHSNGEKFITSSFQTQKDLALMIPELWKNKIGPGLGWEFLGNDTSVKARYAGGTDYLEASSLRAETESGSNKLILGKRYELEYDVYRFEKESLEKLKAADEEFVDIMSGRIEFLNDEDLANLAEVISESDIPIAYSDKTSNQMIRSYEGEIPLLTIPAKLITIEESLNVGFSYKEESEYTTMSGFAVNNEIYPVAQSEMIDSAQEMDFADLWDFVSTLMSTLYLDMEEFYEENGASVEEGVSGKNYTVKSAARSSGGRIVSVITPGEEAQANSYRVNATTDQVRSGTAVNSGSGNVTKTMTIGRPIVLAVANESDGAALSDFSDTPLSLTLRYDEADLESAGLNLYSPVYLEGRIGIYRYSDEGDFFEPVAGESDPDTMSVTATVTEPGQYVLAADACAPSLTGLETSDFGQTPTITAIIDDLTGLDGSKFLFTLDGEPKVSADIFSQHFDPKTGTFTYKVTEPLAEGKHEVVFTLADTSGNEAVYSFVLTVDLTAPVLEDVSVVGSANEGDLVEIRAQVSDENLERVYAVFAVQLPDGSWSDEANVAMQDLGSGLWGLDYQGNGTAVRVRVVAWDVAQHIAESEPVEVQSVAESFALVQDYLLLNVDDTVRLTAEVRPAELASGITWTVEEGGETVISVENGTVTALAEGTAYVIASVSDGEVTLTDRCRIDVAAPIELEDIQLSATKLTAELYSTDYVQFDILLKLPQNFAATAAATAFTPENRGIAIEAAWFADEAVAKLFELIPLDDRTVAVVPTEAALADAKAVQGKYISAVTVTVQGKEYTTEESLTLTVKKTLPKLKATIPAFNNFWSGQTQEITVTGATVTGISCDNLPDWLSLYAGDLSLTEAVPAKGGSAKLTLQVETEEWAVPVETALTVKCSYKAPGLKLSASSIQLAGRNSDGVKLQLQSKDKKLTLSDLGVIGITAPEGYVVSDYNAEDGTFTIKAESGFQPGKINLTVSFLNTVEEVAVPLTVKVTPVTLKLAPNSITLNSGTGDSAAVTVTAAPADYRLTAPDIRIVDAVKQDKTDSGELKLSYENGRLSISTTEATPDNARYTLYISAEGGKEAALKISTTNAEPTLKLKAGGNLDLSFPDRKISLTTTFKNHAGGNLKAIDYTVTESSGKTVLDEDSQAILLTKEGADLFVQLKDTTGINIKNTYTLNLTLTLEDGSTLESSVKIPVKQTAVNLKLSTGKLTLNKAIDDKAAVTVTCTTKDYSFTQPVWQLLDSKGKESAEGKLDINWIDNALVIAVNENTEFGIGYKLMISAEAGAKATTLTVTIPAEAKSNVTGTLKATGNLDVIRDGTALTVTPTWKNCNDADRTETLTIRNGSGEDVTNRFVIAEEDGKYILTRGEELDHTQKYTATLTATFANGETAVATGALKLKMGSAKLTLNADSTTLFANDIRSRVNISFASTDSTLNGVAKVTLDPKLADQYELFDYGNGQYAIGFKNGTVPSKVTSVNLALNVWLEGNEAAKSNAAVKVKLSIV